MWWLVDLVVGWVFGLDFGDGRGFLGSSTAAAMVAGLAGSDDSLVWK